MDIWGCFSTATHVGYRFFLTIMDDHTRMTLIYLLHSKSNVLHILPAFYTYVKVQYGILIKGVCFDNAPELTFTQFFFVIMAFKPIIPMLRPHSRA